MRPLPDTAYSPPPENYDYYGVAGVPYTSDPGTMLAGEYRARTAMVIRAGYGNFDTAKPDQSHYGRTLNEVLSKSMTGEYKMIASSEQWIQCPKFGVRIMQYVQWAEFSNRPTAEAANAAARRPSLPDTFLKSEV